VFTFTAGGGYDLVITSGRLVDAESGSVEDQGKRARLTLNDEQGNPSAHISFYGPEVPLPVDFLSRASRPILHLYTDMLPSVLALLHSGKPVFVDEGVITTTEAWQRLA
jgi:hypothetical protein